MKRKIKYGALALTAGIVMTSQAFAVTYLPNIDESVQVDKIESQEEYQYSRTDVDRTLEIYNKGETVSEEQFKLYDLNEDGIINATDAALVLDNIE